MKILSTLLLLSLTWGVSAPAEWTLAKEKSGVKVYTRIKEGQKLKELKAVATYNCTKENLYKTFVDIQNMYQWYDMVEKVELLKQISPTEGVYKIFFDFPSLAGDRYSTIKASIKKEANGDLKVETRFYPIDHKPEADYVYVKNIESAWRISGKTLLCRRPLPIPHGAISRNVKRSAPAFIPFLPQGMAELWCAGNWRKRYSEKKRWAAVL